MIYDHLMMTCSWTNGLSLAVSWMGTSHPPGHCHGPLCHQVKACSIETHSPSRASKTYGHNAFQIIHIHSTVISSGRAHTTQHCTHCGLWLRLQSWLMPQSPCRLRN